MWHDIQSFSVGALKFLRPQALWLFVAAGMWLIIYFLSTRRKQTWQKHISPELRPYVITKSAKWMNHMPFVGFFLALCFGILALAGPSWMEVEMPASKVSARMIIGLNVSRSMLAEDLQPNRLERAKLKIGSILEADPGVETGVFVYAGTPHLLLPPTADYTIIEKQIESINPGIMPLQGNNTRLFFGLIDSLFSEFLAPGTLLWITDEVNQNDVTWMGTFASNTPHYIELLIVSTQGGSIIDAGTLASMQTISKLEVNRLTLDDSDIEAIATRVRQRREFSPDAGNLDEQNRDMGLIFIWPMILLLAVSFRKGAVIYSMLFMAMLNMNSCSYEKPGARYWYTQDRIGYEYFKNGEYEKALEHLEDEHYRALAFYQLGDYSASAQLFKEDTTSSGKYNLGLAFFNLGLYEEAARAFEDARVMNPDLTQAADAALIANRYAEENSLTEEQEEIKKKIVGGEVSDNEGSSQELSSEEGEKNEDEDDPNRSKSENAPDDGERRGEEADAPDLSDDQNQMMDSKNIMLRKTSADPSEFLRKRFNMQKQKYYPDVK